MIRVGVCGCLGRMGSATMNAVHAADDMELVCGVDPHISSNSQLSGEYDGTRAYASLAEAIGNEEMDVVVDFTRPDVVAGNVALALENGIDCVVGTTGLTEDALTELASKAIDGACLFYAPNFTTGAVLMMIFARMAAPYFPQAEIIEFHHANKLDSPSGTAVSTAHLISGARDGKPSEAPGKETENAGAEGARGALVDGIPVHSVRSMGFVADQEVIFGSMGQTLTIKHSSWDRESYMPGVLLGIRSVVDASGLIIGLDNFMDI